MTTGFIGSHETKPQTSTDDAAKSRDEGLARSTAATRGQGNDVGSRTRGGGETAPAGGSGATPTTADGPAGEGPNTVAEGEATETTADFKAYGDITGGTLGDFDSYAYAQADWSMGITDQGQKDQLRQILDFLREDACHVTALGEFKVSHFVAAGLGNLGAMRAYANAQTETKETVKINQATAVSDAVAKGEDILKLESAVQGPVLKWIFTPDDFENLRTQNGNQVGDFVSYVKKCDPLLHANDGWEIKSYMMLSQTSKPESFTDLTDIRNYHRFQDAALQGLRASQGGNPDNKPMTLVLQSAFDHNAAFHHDPEMTTVINEPSNHTVMIEGASSLAQISGRLPGLVEKHGRSEDKPNNSLWNRIKGLVGLQDKQKKIDQVMIAGHGHSKGIELAGTLQTDEAGAVQTAQGMPMQDNQGLELSSDPGDPQSQKVAAQSVDFMRELMTYMSVDPNTPHGRIVFNACLTASNEIDPSMIDGTLSKEDQQKQMMEQYRQNPSIVDKMREIAGEQGRDIDVLGGNASFGRVGLIDSTGGLDIVADGTDPGNMGYDRTDDPELTNQDKFVYIEKGTEPSGTLLAVAECWAQDPGRAIDAVKARRASPLGSHWSEAVIQCFYELIETKYADNGAGIAALAPTAHGFEQLANESDARIWLIWRLPGDWEFVKGKLSQHASWNQTHVPVVFYQAWSMRDSAKIPEFLTALAAMNCRTASPYIHMDAIRNRITEFIPNERANNPPNPGRLRVALLDYIKSDAMTERTKKYLSSLVRRGSFKVDVAGPMGGLRSADELLMELGLHPRQQHAQPDPTPTMDFSTTPDANVDMSGDGKNDAYVDGLSKMGAVIVDNTQVRAQPSESGRLLSGTLSRGSRVYIMGQSGDWYLIDFRGQRGYANKSSIRA